MRALIAALALLAGPALAADTTPFYRAGNPFFLGAAPLAQQYAIAQPKGTSSYRLVNPCSVDIRIVTVGTMAGTVTAATGTRFLARTAEVVASSKAMTTPRIVSVMTVGDPGPAGCTVELQYGTGQ